MNANEIFIVLKDDGDITSAKKNEFHRLILKLKAMHSNIL